ncbi:3-beta hydroxysteroid dehydrogenase [Nocardioides gansuensis]|uniref:3-beta hydroxysteroid dehydrogenase n=1 Tax=Nocardioides gansuensis TaxID=2138300 RepID=A0A2T8F8H0_9ACTN|nr:SDR family oxidoreductase [Nocardioides gansuensis]PVG82024.1 3-beta hydroxysteroid dehydrogenase [Nocardioides gansuensis]
MRIAVAGGTGVVGRHVVSELEQRAHEPVVLARSTGQDLTTGTGIAQALAGVEAVIDVSNLQTLSAKASREFFEKAAHHLLPAEEAAGVRHHVALSIVGIDRVDFGYYLGKRRQEELVLAGPIPATVLRATQFHEFPGQLLDRIKGPVALVPRMRSQTVAASEVAAHLVDLAEGPARGMTDEMAGPEVHEMPELARRIVKARGQRRPVVPMPLPGEVGRQMAGDGLLPRHAGPRGRITFSEWLAQA